MRILYRDLRRGVVKVQPESSDDLWLLSILVQPGDLVRARTVREVRFGERGSGRSSRVPMVLTVRVEAVEFQAFTSRLRIRGVVVEGPERFGVKGKHHTLSIDVGHEVEIAKPGGWPSGLLERLEKAVPAARVVVVAVDYDEAAVAVVEGQGVRVVYEDYLRLPGKDDPGREDRLREAVAVIARETARAVAEAEPQLVFVGGPGGVKRLVVERLRESMPSVRVVVEDLSMGGRAGVEEALRRGVVRRALGEAASAAAEEFMERLEALLAKNPDMVAYGWERLLRAVEAGAVGEMLVLDEKLRSPDPEERRRVYELLLRADAQRARIVFVSRETPAGQKLWGLGGLAAILRYPLPD